VPDCFTQFCSLSSSICSNRFTRSYSARESRSSYG